MERMTLAEYGPGDPFIKPLVLMDAKEGKTSFLFMSLLGLWPWQQHGGVVSDPAHLHFIALDTACMDRIIPRDPPDGRSLMEMAGVPMKTIDYVRSRVDVIKMDKEVAAVMNSAASYNHDWFKAMKLLRQDLASRMKDPKETHAVVMSSWTTMCHHHERCLFGSPTGQGESNAHVSKQAVPNSKPPAFEDTLSIHGGAKEWPKNTSHNFRVVRETVQWKDKNGKSTLINPMYVNPKPSYSFVPGGGRGVGALAEKEPDLTKMMMDMGYQVGGWKP
jgi:hypothetical protein